MPRRPLLLILLLALLSPACHPGHYKCYGPDRTTTSVSPTWLRTELFFGLHQRNGSLVSDEGWRAFLDSHVTPSFPNGLTVVEADGRYRDAQGRIHHEPARILILLYPAHTRADVDAKLRTIAAE